ncbi:MAG: HipA N-terminal domain-containing protein [Candidatus Magnetoglobus multicellularis str. Araruama]|uniref:HipA N-terminal domain-containing protein n=1 Tax=Candidatus Magnetoglobus multicellularis str. Araruama TaxID=890399 RepID=A0A1V1P0H1_9BACT|nr:MAG: HipA N-terminal domain-containing protein [Candidatus Magnetoglobus multicellularis str. Araruama]
MVHRRALVFWHGKMAGILSEYDNGYNFQYDNQFLNDPSRNAISLTMPLQNEPYESKTMFPFFDGLIPEGWLLDMAIHIWKLDPRDRMGLLLTCCKDCIGAVSIQPEKEKNESAS